MSKAIITIEHEGGSQFNISVDFYPTLQEGKTHPAADVAMSMLNHLNTKGTTGDMQVFGDDE